VADSGLEVAATTATLVGAVIEEVRAVPTPPSALKHSEHTYTVV
jgi:hypothetical protein